MIPIKDFEELCDVINGDHIVWEIVQEDSDAGKHDITQLSYLLKNRTDDKLYCLHIDRSYNDGLDPYDTIEYPLILDEVEITKTSTYYHYQIKVK